MEQQFRNIVEGAALMTGTQAEIKTMGVHTGTKNQSASQ
jgi:metal-dependent amidase/aminoacylase/carboxypeptidase family protein